MGEPTLMAIVRGGHTRFYVDEWAKVTLHRELIWGPAALEEWIVAREELIEFEQLTSSVVIVDFDRKLLTYRIESDALEIPKIGALFNRLVATAWPGYEIACVALDQELLEALGEETEPEWSTNRDYARIEYRPESVASAVGDFEDDIDDDMENFDDDFDEDFEEDLTDELDESEDTDTKFESNDRHRSHAEDDEEEDDLEFGETELRAWVTIIGADGSMEHRQLSELPQELLQAKPSAIEELAQLPACEVPAEVVVREGLWVESSSRVVSVWGGPSTQSALPVLETCWKGWTVQWAPRGYAQHCAATGPSGKVLSTEEALAKLVPTFLSTDRLSLKSMLTAIGGAVKKTAVKATGCLVFILCLPILIFGLVSGNWRAVGWTIAITVALVIVGFKTIEWQLKKKFNQTIRNAEVENNIHGPSAAGPLNPSQRRAALETLLEAAGLPALSKITPYVKAEDIVT